MSEQVGFHRQCGRPQRESSHPLKLVTLLVLAVIVLSACNGDGARSPVPATMPAPGEIVATGDTAEATDEVALPTSAVDRTSTPNALQHSATPTSTTTITPTSTGTPTSSPIPTLEVTPTPAKPLAVALQSNTNLRLGPGTNYGIAGIAGVANLDVVGKHGGWLEMRRADGSRVWGLSTLFQLSGDVEAIPNSTDVPPTPEPTATQPASETTEPEPTRSPASEVGPAPIPGLLGYWENETLDTSGITRLRIRLEADTLFIHMWGRCHPTDCVWGETTTAGTDAGDGVLSLTWKHWWKTETQQLSILADGRLQVSGHAHYTDNSGRVDRDYVEYYVAKVEDPNLPEGFYSQPSIDCTSNKPPGTVCLAWDDDYKWAVRDTILDWKRLGYWQDWPIVAALAQEADYQHIVGTDYVRRVAH